MLNKDEGAIRAAVLAVNDGLVSNFSLVMGVAGSTVGAEIVTIAGWQDYSQGHFQWQLESIYPCVLREKSMKIKF